MANSSQLVSHSTSWFKVNFTDSLECHSTIKISYNKNPLPQKNLTGFSGHPEIHETLSINKYINKSTDFASQQQNSIDS